MNHDARSRGDMFRLLWRLWGHLGASRRRQFSALFILMLLGAFGEVLSLGAVLPFLGVLVSPDRVFAQPLVERWAFRFGIDAAAGLVLPLTLVFVAVAIAAGAVRLLVLWASTRFSFAVGVDLSIQMYRRTLYQPYKVHVARNSSEVISGITNKTSTVVTGVLLPSLFLISAVVVLLSIVAMALAIDSAVAVWAAIGFGVSYALVTVVSRRPLEASSRRIARGQTDLFKALQEGLGGIRDVILDGTQAVYCDTYYRADRSVRTAQGSVTFISASPRFAMEALGMSLMAIIAYLAVTRGGEIGVALPVLGALALGAQRLIPSFQQAYGSWTTMVGSRASLFDTLVLLDQPLPAEAALPPPEPLTFHRELRVAGVRFHYSDEGPWILRDLDLTIRKGARVGIVGATGSGKSTLVDLLMGLLDPTEGEVLVDGEALLGARKRAWQRTVAHVPQAVFLADATLAENIALGVLPAQIDMERVRRAARQAQIADFIESGVEGYGAFVGERGVRLSGGQRQRIGIARALYKRATVLIFDEATSALDSHTEQAVMRAIDALGDDLTIIIIAHRLTTLRNCDPIIEVGGGRVVNSGTHEALGLASHSFGAPGPA